MGVMTKIRDLISRPSAKPNTADDYLEIWRRCEGAPRDEKETRALREPVMDVFQLATTESFKPRRSTKGLDGSYSPGGSPRSSRPTINFGPGTLGYRPPERVSRKARDGASARTEEQKHVLV